MGVPRKNEAIREFVNYLILHSRFVFSANAKTGASMSCANKDRGDNYFFSELSVLVI